MPRYLILSKHCQALTQTPKCLEKKRALILSHSVSHRETQRLAVALKTIATRKRIQEVMAAAVAESSASNNDHQNTIY